MFEGVDRNETAVVVAIRVGPPLSVPGKVNSPASIPNAVYHEVRHSILEFIKVKDL